MAATKARRILRWFGLLVFVLAAATVVVVVNAIWYRPFSIDVFFERVFIEYALKDPEMLSSIRLLEGFGITGHNDDLTDASPEFDRELLEKSKRDLATLRSYDHGSMSPEQTLSRDILDWYLQYATDGEPYLLYNYPVNQLFGVQSNMPTFMATIHQVGNEKEAEQYLTRVGKFGAKFEQVLRGLKLREEAGIVPPRFVIDRVLTEMTDFVSGDPKENILYTALDKKLSEASSISEAQKTELLGRCAAMIEDSVCPAYNTFIEYFQELQSVATTDDGVSKFPDGDAFYAYALRGHTTTNLTPDEVHAIGLTEVERIRREMWSVLESIGKSGKPLADLIRELQADPTGKYPATDEGRAKCLADYQAIIDEIDQGLDSAFDLRPNIGVKVERIPEFKEKTAPGAYYDAPALDGSREGVFYANLRNMDEVIPWGMKTLAYHEAIPGHHFQIAIQQQIEGPTFRKLVPFTAYMEGWALYAERLAWELGFEKDPLSNLGRLQAEMFRAVRLVVDTGIHSKRWTRQQAIDYMLENTGMPEGDVVAEIERYIVNPGQACAYKIGMLKILELRERSMALLGDKFDLRAFHNVIIGNGAMPLDVLQKVVDQYIESVRFAGAA